MKSYFNYLSAVLWLITAVSCTKPESQGTDHEKDDGEFSITASFVNDQTWPETEEQRKIYWNPGDELEVFYVKKSGRLSSELTSRSTESEFTGDFDFKFGSVGGGKYLWALYPYREDAQGFEDMILTALPSVQEGKEGSFLKEMNISVGMSETPSLKLRFVCGGIRFSVTRSDVRQVVLRSRDRESLAGVVLVTFDAGEPVVEHVYDGIGSITLNAPGDGTFKPGEWYYIVTLPGMLNKGFWLTFYTKDKIATYNHFERISIVKSRFESFPDADMDLEYTEKVPKPEGEYIKFENPATKRFCLRFDKNGDGEVSYKEAASVESVTRFYDPGLTEFDEFRFFTGLTSLPDEAFSGCPSLRTVTIPEGIKKIGNNAFWACEKLISVKFAGDVLESVGGRVFGFCYSLESIDFPPDLQSIGSRAFYGCRSLESVVIPNSVTEMFADIFEDCVSLKSVQLPSSLAYVPKGLFRNCISLENVVFPEAVKTIEGNAFERCAFFKDGISRIDVPSSVTSIHSKGIPAAKNIFLTSPTPVIIRERAFASYAHIFVPASLLAEYKSMPEWKDYRDNIHAIDEYPLPVQQAHAPEGTVDLGLSVYWASCNLGSSSPKEQGDCYSWGDIQMMRGGDWPEYIWAEGDPAFLTKYNTKEESGVVDGKTVLDPEDDVASVILGGKFRIPTTGDYLELYNLCSWRLILTDCDFFYEVTSRINGNSIIIPGGPMYWTSEVSSDDPFCAWFVDHYSMKDSGEYVELSLSPCLRFGLNNIRPVSD